MPTSTPTLYLGIDAGGTFTDGVLFDPNQRTIVKSTKVLTTHYDLKLCVAQVLVNLLDGGTPDIGLVSLSTTLATNAIAEGKKKPAALFLFGYDPELVHKFKFHHQFGAREYFFVDGRHDLNGVEQTPLDQAELRRLAREVQERVEAFAVSSYAGPANASHEQLAAETIAAVSALPVVQAHHLSSELDSIRRATTASLNAALLANVQDFLDAVQEMLARYAINCPLMVVRGDGSIVQASFARHRPVEMIHSGPATSAIGGMYMAGVDSALVIDVGGTTTDIALIEGGLVKLSEGAATVGNHRTCIKTIQARSFGLGGDSLIAFDHWGNLAIGPDRVTPLARFSREFPELKDEMLALFNRRQGLNYSDELEYWILQREPKQSLQEAKISRIVEALRQRPLRLRDLKKRLGAISPMLIQEIINMEIIDRTGLTPTDLLHVSGEYTPWDGEIPALVCEMAARNWNEEPPAFIQRVRAAITERITSEIIQFLSKRQLSDRSAGYRSQALDRWLYEESIAQNHPFLGCSIFLKIPIVGIGAPARIFLSQVAEALRTRIIFPDHFEVANAVGTVVGNIVSRQEGDVFPCVEGAAITGFFARAASAQVKFARFEDALAHARTTLSNQVQQEVIKAGAEIAVVNCEENKIWEGMVHLVAWAIGKPGIDGNQKADL